MKLVLFIALHGAVASSSTRGTWIEIRGQRGSLRGCWSSSTRGTWIEMIVEANKSLMSESSSTRGTWIEISMEHTISSLVLSSSTRGTWIEICSPSSTVISSSGRPPHGGRGLKSRTCTYCFQSGRSSSTRGTWIEIYHTAPQRHNTDVVLHTGDVD